MGKTTFSADDKSRAQSLTALIAMALAWLARLAWSGLGFQGLYTYGPVGNTDGPGPPIPGLAITPRVSGFTNAEHPV